MHYLRKELNKILPLALLFGAIGGVILIAVTNVLSSNMLSIFALYALIVSVSLYVLNHMKYKHEFKCSLLYGYCVFAMVTLIAFIDLMMNTNPHFINPLFENMVLFWATFASVGLIALSITYLFKKKIIS